MYYHFFYVTFIVFSFAGSLCGVDSSALLIKDSPERRLVRAISAGDLHGVERCLKQGGLGVIHRQSGKTFIELAWEYLEYWDQKYAECRCPKKCCFVWWSWMRARDIRRRQAILALLTQSDSAVFGTKK